MNTILQKRIEEAAKRYAWANDTIALPTDKKVRVPIGEEISKAVTYGAVFTLQNQWISVEEALPKTSNRFSKDVLCIDNRGCMVVAKYQDGVGWWSRSGTHWNTNGFTHWMPMPALEGDKR